jgi:hypothetical protein
MIKKPQWRGGWRGGWLCLFESTKGSLWPEVTNPEERELQARGNLRGEALHKTEGRELHAMRFNKRRRGELSVSDLKVEGPERL